MNCPLGLAAQALALVVASSLGAQTTADSVIFHPTRGVQIGQDVRVSLSGNRYAGRVQRTGVDSLFLGAASNPVGIRISAIDTLWRRGNFERVGSNVGMVTLGLLGAVAVAAVYVGAAEGGQSAGGEEWGAMALGAAGGTAIGWFVGALVGKAIPRWQRVYSR
ncbi:MAG TPA: hypothetical protein VEB19_07365 [Gemmatimonadaceae bacterium]|nr:hypothetical protein [Gemmatimonadaceae bacterium]